MIDSVKQILAEFKPAGWGKGSGRGRFCAAFRRAARTDPGHHAGAASFAGQSLFEQIKGVRCPAAQRTRRDPHRLDGR